MSAFRNPLDADEQLSLFGENPGDYLDTQLNWLQDSQSTNREIRFDNLPFVNNLTSWNDAFITVPIEITGTEFSSSDATTTALAMAAGSESIFTQVRFQLSAGSSMLNEINHQSALINPIRKQIEWSDDKLKTYGPENMYAMNHLDTGGYNIGFNTAANLFREQIVTRTSSTGLSLLIKVYLRDLHDLFKNLTWPMLNFRWELYFRLGWPFNTNSTFHSLLQATSGTTITSATVTNVAGSTTFLSGCCRLYQRHIKLNPVAELKLAAMLDTGFTKRVHFLETEVSPMYNAGASTGSNTLVNFQVATNSTNVKRVIIFGVPAGTFSTSSSFSAASAGNYPWCTAPNSRLSLASLLVNNQPLYTRVLTLDNEFYMETRNQLVDSGLSMKSGSLINYEDWKLGTQLYYVFDLTRIRNRTSTEQPVNLYFSGTRTSDTQSIDWYAIMEKDAVIDFSVSRTSAQIVRVL